MNNDFFLVLVDAHSNWPEIHRMRSTTAEKTIEVIEHVFATWGPCKSIVSDNGPQFTSSQFAGFCSKWGVTRVRVPEGFERYVPGGFGTLIAFHGTLHGTLKFGS